MRSRSFRVLAISAVASMIALSTCHADEVARIDQRYAVDTDQVPNFRQDVVPLLGKLGCNGRACHGSFQGRGGFRLSLFGYDFKADHEMMTSGDNPRVNLEHYDESLILQKPTETVSHEGGLRLKPGSWQYRVLARWIEAGARPVDEQTPTFVRLDVMPAEIVAKGRGETFRLKAMASWSDGSKVDVTPLCRFKTNDDQIATVDEDGTVTAAGAGDSHVVVMYDNGVVPVSVTLPVNDKSGENYPAVPTRTTIDALVVAKLRKLGIVPSDLCNDHEFLRRVSLDIAGTLPTVAEVELFSADTTDSKRVRKIDELLERPAYAAWWANRFSDWTGNNATKLFYPKSGIDAPTRANEWYEWLRVRVANNTPYDKIAEGLILSAGRSEGESYEQYCERMSGYYQKKPKGNIADQPTMPHYWIRRDFAKPEERALGFAYSFLGLRIQCAQCHKHPFDQWTKDDFDRFTAFFGRARFGIAPSAKEEYAQMLERACIDLKELKGNDLGKEVKEHLARDEVMPFDELFVIPGRPVRKNNKNAKRPQVAGRTAKVLGGDEVSVDEIDDPRKALMEWLRDDDNPYFAKAIVNRIWSGYFNAGIVDPVDDLSLANPPSNEPLLDHLASEFRAHGYDLKWLHRTIANTDTYQRSWRTNETNKSDERNFSHAVPRRLPAEVAYDAVQIATMTDPAALKWRDGLNGRATANGGIGIRGSRGRNDYALAIFGRSVRESNCECDRSSEASLLQTVYLQNDNDVLTMIEDKGRWTEQVLQRPGQKKAAGPTTDSGSKRENKLAQASLKQLRRRLENLKDKGRTKAVEAIEQEIASREHTGTDEDDEPVSALTVDADLEALVRQAYLRTLSRPPTEDEFERVETYFVEVDRARGLKDLLWALINTREFITNH